MSFLQLGDDQAGSASRICVVPSYIKSRPESGKAYLRRHQRTSATPNSGLLPDGWNLDGNPGIHDGLVYLQGDVLRPLGSEGRSAGLVITACIAAVGRPPGLAFQSPLHAVNRKSSGMSERWAQYV